MAAEPRHRLLQLPGGPLEDAGEREHRGGGALDAVEHARAGGAVGEVEHVVELGREALEVLPVDGGDEGLGERLLHVVHHLVALVLVGLHGVAHRGHRHLRVAQPPERLRPLVRGLRLALEVGVEMVLAREEEADDVLEVHAAWCRRGAPSPSRGIPLRRVAA